LLPGVRLPYTRQFLGTGLHRIDSAGDLPLEERLLAK